MTTHVNLRDLQGADTEEQDLAMARLLLPEHTDIASMVCLCSTSTLRVQVADSSSFYGGDGCCMLQRGALVCHANPDRPQIYALASFILFLIFLC